MAIECVTLETAHLFPGNPIAAQHKLRYRAIIERQQWDVPVINGLEYDNYDNPSAIYLIYRDKNLVARGVARLCHTDRPFMFKEVFPHMCEQGPVPVGHDILEGSRFCIDRDLPIDMRRRVAAEIVCSSLEYCLAFGVKKMIGVMYPVYWKNLFSDNGLEVTWLGSSVRTPDGKKSRAGYIVATPASIAAFREKTGLTAPVIRYGEQDRTGFIEKRVA